MDSFSRFLAKLYERIRAKFKDGDLTADEFHEAVKAARGHIGGTIRWENAREGEGSQMNEWRLVGEVALSEDKASGQVQIFPAVGKYSHPRYGELAITPEFLATIKAHFDGKIYQQDLPLTIDLEHESKLSGASGWIKDVEIRGEKGMWATVEFNDRGKSLVADNAYKYFSPEFYDTWQDPATSKSYQDLLIGGALTNRPFFKGMAPVAVMSEDSLLFVEAAGDGGNMAECMAMMQKCLEMMAGMKDEMPEGMMAEMQGMMGKMKKSMPSGDHTMAEKTEDGTAYPQEAYLYTPDPGKPSEWKLRVYDASMKPTRAQLGAAAAALGPGFRGEKVQLPDGEKEKALAKLRAAYGRLGIKPEEMPVQIRASMVEAGLSEQEASACLKEIGLDNQPNGGGPMGMTEEEARQLTEMQTSLRTLSERLASETEARKAAEGEAKAAAERVMGLEREANRRTLTEFVRSHRLAFSETEVPAAVDRLEKMQAKLGEDFEGYLAEKRSLSERIETSDLFRQTSHAGPGHGASGAAGEFEVAKRKMMSENAGMSEADAIVKVARENPQLYARYDRQFKAGTKRGGE